MNTFSEEVERLVQAAAKADKSDDAVRFAQAALNAAHAAQVLVQTEASKK